MWRRASERAGKVHSFAPNGELTDCNASRPLFSSVPSSRAHAASAASHDSRSCAEGRCSSACWPKLPRRAAESVMGSSAAASRGCAGARLGCASSQGLELDEGSFSMLSPATSSRPHTARQRPSPPHGHRVPTLSHAIRFAGGVRVQRSLSLVASSLARRAWAAVPTQSAGKAGRAASRLACASEIWERTTLLLCTSESQNARAQPRGTSSVQPALG